MQYLGLELEHLPNNEQRQAIESLDGPVLVIAGPGTGKTQLLSLRVANILHSKDVSPHNVLCLTFTNAGASAMTKRLAQLIGPSALGVHISTFHSFASGLRTRFLEYFQRGVLDAAVPDLRAKTELARLLAELSIHDPLYQRPYKGLPSNLSEVTSCISTLKKSGLSPAQIAAIATQNLEFFEYVQGETSLIGLIDDALKGSRAAKFAKLDALPHEIAAIVQKLPSNLTEPLISTPGVYLPYAQYLVNSFLNTQLYDDDGKTVGFQNLRDSLFKANPRVFKDQEKSKKLLSVIGIYKQYQDYLAKNGFYDYDDMIFDALHALEDSSQLRAMLAEQYQYILVDEFQDTNGSQMRLLDLLAGSSESPNILVVGDDDQAIYRFQGASVEYLNAFEQHYPHTKRIVLNTNYRSTPSLVGLGAQLAEQIENRAPASKTQKKLRAHKKELAATSFVAHCYTSSELQYYEVARAIRQRIDAGFMQESLHPGEEIAVIARNHSSLRGLIVYLRHFDIPYNYDVSTTVAQIEPLQTLLKLLRFCAYYAAGSKEHAEALLPSIVSALEFGIEPRVYFSFAVSLHKERISWMQALERSPHEQLSSLFTWLTELSFESLNSPVRSLILKAAKPLLAYYEGREKAEPFDLIEFNYGVRALLKFVEGELEAERNTGGARPLRLADVVSLYDEAERFSFDIDIEVPVVRSEAISLMSAHKSKGLEFDLVYLLDADDQTWHTRKADRGYISQNMLISESGDIDDDRRLLFVAATRARESLEASFYRGELVRELMGIAEVREVETNDATIATISAHCWEDNFYPSNASIMALADPLFEGRALSVSLLNSFVTYKDEYDSRALEGGSFFRRQILRLPSEPSIALDFGNIVHELMEQVFTLVVKGSGSPQNAAFDTTVQELLANCQQKIAWLDYEAAIIAHHQERFLQIADLFLPKLYELLSNASGTLEYCSEYSLTTTIDDILLTGKCDLLICDSATKTIEVYDYKTGNPDTATFDAGYLRQLQFYKLLIENSSEFEGWTVRGGADLFVEPSAKQGGVLAKQRFHTVSTDDLGHLQKLIAAVWHRIQHRRLDCSAFEASPQLAALKASRSPQKPKSAEVQLAFELWLIDEHTGT
ncbi:MAG: ATP-dependent helicase [Coriobacteriia bacterium]|nr:ATP-dependent helicase [Coriobacteriia bacterium]